MIQPYQHLPIQLTLLIQLYSATTKVIVSTPPSKPNENVEIILQPKSSSTNINAKFTLNPSQDLFSLTSQNQKGLKIHAGHQMAFDQKASFTFLDIPNFITFDPKIKIDKKPIYPREWTLYYLETFETDTTFWKHNNFEIKRCTNYDDNFLMHDCKSPFSEMYYLVNSQPRHTEQRVNMNFHYIDQWQDQQAYLKIDQTVVWTESFHWCQGLSANTCYEKGLDSCGSSYPDQMGDFIVWNGQHNQDKLNITVGTNIPFENCDLTWGIDNIEIFIR